MKQILFSTITLLLIATAYVVVFDNKWFKARIEEKLSADRPQRFVIGGDLEIDPGLITRLRMHSVSLQGPDTSGRPALFKAQRVDVDLDLWSLIQGPTHIARIFLLEPRLALMVNQDGSTNWEGLIGTDNSKDRTRIDTVVLESGRIALCDKSRAAGLTARIQSLQTQPAQPISLRAEGVGWPLGSSSPQGRGGTCEVPPRFDGHESVALQLDLKPLPESGSRYAGSFSLTGSDPYILQQWLDLPVLRPGRFRLSSHFSLSLPKLHFNQLQAQVGQSDVAGSLVLTLPQDNQLGIVSSDLHSQRLVWGDFMTSGQQDSTAHETDLLTRLQQLNWKADIQYSADELQLSQAHFQQVELAANLNDQRLQLKGVKGRGGGGDLTGQFTLNTADDPARAHLNFDLRGVELQKLLAGTDAGHEIAGKVAGSVDLESEGSSKEQLLQHTRGEVRFIMQDGRIDQLLVEKLKLDLSEIALLKLSDGTSITPIECAVAPIDVHAGIAETRKTILSTAAATLHVQGEVNLANQQANLTVLTGESDHADFEPDTVIDLSGPIEHLNVNVRDSGMGGELAGAIALGALVNPLAAVLPMLDLQESDDSGAGGNCQHLLERVRSSSPQSGQSTKASSG